MAGKTNAVIIRRSKKPGHAQRHGGHWKVAYADFMTAMMAFFLLLWILSVSDEDKLEGIAQFFTPTDNVAGNPGGEGILQGSALADDQNVLAAPAAEEAKSSEAAPNPWAALAKESTTGEETPAPLGETLKAAGQTFLENIREQPALANLAGNLLVQQIEGQLVVDILDLGENEMFPAGAATPSANLQLVLEALTPTIIALPHPIRITGHTNAIETPEMDFPNGEARNANADQIDPWEVSAARAHAVRTALHDLGLDNSRFSLISGAADSRPLDPLNPDEARNRRVTIELGSALD